jgi:hypothetical protein
VEATGEVAWEGTREVEESWKLAVKGSTNETGIELEQEQHRDSTS